jgi:hypothetical protein
MISALSFLFTKGILKLFPTLSFMQYGSSDPFYFGPRSEFIASLMFFAVCVQHTLARGCASSEAELPSVPFLRGGFLRAAGRPCNAIIETMSSEYSPSGTRRSSRRGSNRRSERGNRSGSAHHENKPKAKKTLLARILGFLTGKQEEPKRPAREERSPRSAENAPAERPARERQSRSERPTGMRTPEVVEVSSPRLYVGNLSFDAGESDLFDLFNGVGSVQNVEIVVNRHNMRSKGFAFVQMQSVDEAKRAVSELHDKDFMGRKLVVSGAKALEERRSERTAQAAE